MQVYLVGGAVRDALLGLTVKDRDWVVVGASSAQMLKLGYESVGKDFPVFLHPKTHEEYALARTERKTAAGYHGFAFDTANSVTLKQDLQRRDLTINAMAQDAQGHIIDPYGGQADLAQGILRHVSLAFAEDPVRILRVARFAARYNFTVAPETLDLMRQMVGAGEVDALVPERIWQELSKALLEPYPIRFFQVLTDSQALTNILPFAATLQQHHPEAWAQTLHRLQYAAAFGHLKTSYAIMCLAFTKPLSEVHTYLKVPKDCADAANVLQMAYPVLQPSQSLSAQTMLAVFERCDAWRRPERWEQLWQTCQYIAQADGTSTPNSVWQIALDACMQLNIRALIAPDMPKHMIAQTIRQARLDAIAHSFL